MTIVARYQPGAVRTPFVNREGVLEAFTQELARLGQQPKLLVLTGVGGIGKSRLLHELRLRAAQANRPVATLNLQEPAQRFQLSGLASLRAQLGEAKVRFDRFDIGYAVWWQRLNPHVQLSAERLAFAKGSEVLSSMLDEMSGVPVFGSALYAMDVATRKFKRWRAVRAEAALQEFDELSLDQQADAVTYLFAKELNAHGPYVMCIDAYEALIGGVQRGGLAMAADAWLRDLVWQLDRGLVAVASREPLGWQRYDSDWAARLREIPVGPLPFAARIQLLAELGETDERNARAIADESDGLPFYLNLAHEAGPVGGSGTTRGQMEERFMRNVDPDLVPIFELLSVARVFDREIFSRLTAHYGMRRDTRAWENLIAHSFVAHAGPGTLQLHQVMAKAIRERLSVEMLDELHALLHEAWRARTATNETAESWREAAHHAAYLQVGRVPALLQCADRLAALAGKPGLDALLVDLHEAPRPDELQVLRRLMAAEAAFLVGDAQEVVANTANIDADISRDADEITARLHLSAAHADRILGNTASAMRRYAEVWTRYQGQVGLDAGTWFADLQMAQGRFADAVNTATEVLRRCPPDRHELRGDLARLLFLANRFAFDLGGAASHLDTARAAYAQAKHLVGNANVLTNTAELLVLTDPITGVTTARVAIAAQQRLGADHELGKSYTALALGLLARGELGECGSALDRAVEVLDRCRYRSGRARAELVRAMWHARSGRLEPAQASVIWAVTELEEAEVYPTMIMLAGVLLDRIGLLDERVTQAANRARAQVQPLHGMDDLISKIKGLVQRMIADRWDEIFAQSFDATQIASGFYHRNVRVGTCLVREPLPGAENMDLHLWPEATVLSVVNRHVDAPPKLLAVSHDPPYQIHEWIDGTVLDEVAPRGTRVPVTFPQAAVKLFADLEHVPLAELPSPTSDWPSDGDCAAFGDLLLSVTKAVHSRSQARYASVWRKLGIPADPFAPLKISNLKRRPFRLVHADVHRKNVMIKRGGVYRFVDWQLALAGDPVYELAVHLHKMGYQPDEQETVMRLWSTACERGRWPGWEVDMRIYLAHEQVKSTIVDSVRYVQLVTHEPQQLEPRALSLYNKLVSASLVWNQRPPTLGNVTSVLADHAAGQ